MISCTSPLHCFTIGYDKDGKPIKEITSSAFTEYKGSYKFQEVPCGRCLACRLARSRDWANRCMLELQYHDDAHFLTLTYDDDHIPKEEWITSDGEVVETAVLVKRDLQLFLKRLRKKFPQANIRYYACGEYGSQTMRPHYHMILYGLHLDDLKFYKNTKLGYNLYNSETLDRVWKNGYVVVGAVSWDTCAYTARYIVKKRLGPDAATWYKQHHLEPEFVIMSLKPAIGRRYYDDNVNTIFDSNYMYLPTDDGCRQITPPLYFRRLKQESDSEFFTTRSELSRNSARTKRRLMKKDSHMDYLEQLRVQDENLKAKTKALARKEI